MTQSYMAPSVPVAQCKLEKRFSRKKRGNFRTLSVIRSRHPKVPSNSEDESAPKSRHVNPEREGLCLAQFLH